MRTYQFREAPPAGEVAKLKELIGSSVLATVCWHRGLNTVSKLEHFLNDHNLLAIDELHDLKSVGKEIKKHVKLGSRIVIYGDYDADGAVAAAILWRFLAGELKANATVYIPDRHDEGYGLNRQALEKLAAEKTDLVITVDCGVRDRELIAEIRKKYPIDIIVTDHHQPGEHIPDCPVLHPLFPGKESKNPYTSGGVVVWKLVRYLEQLFGLKSEFSDRIIDLAGVSLVTDMMPLLGENRVMLKRALQQMRLSPTVGLRMLAEVAQAPITELSTYHLGYVIGPRLNASGRIGNQYTSVRLLSTENIHKAREYALEANEINLERQNLTKDILQKADEAKMVISEKLVVTAGEGWEDGIIGLVAGKLMNRLNLPTITVTIDSQKGIAKGSARSFGEFDITRFFTEISEVFDRFGGHQNAAGFTLKSTDTELFVQAIQKQLELQYATYLPVSISFVDAVVTPPELNNAFFKQLAKLEPFGQQNPEPIFALTGKVEQFSVLGKQQNHVKIQLQCEGGTISAMAFDGLTYVSLLEQGKEVTVIGKPKINEFQGRKEIVMYVDDIIEAVRTSQ